MKKIFNIFLSSILLLQIFLFSPSAVLAAANCPVTTSPSPVTTNEQFIDITIDTSGSIPNYTASDPNNKYWVKLNGNIIKDVQTNRLGHNYQVVNERINVQHVNEKGYLAGPGTFQANKNYTISVQEPNFNDVSICTSSFIVNAALSGGACKIDVLNPPDKFTVNDDITMRVTNLGGNPGDGRRIVIKRNKENEKNDYRTFNNKVGELSTELGVVIGKFEAGFYYLEIRSGQDFLANKDCYTNFGVGEKGGFGPVGQFPTPEPICKGGFCETALGKIFTDPTNFVRNFFGILLSLAGGIALILIIISGYRLMASGGNPEKVQAAREQLTSAIVGLLFIIFSLSILQIIGVDILKIPGFSR